MVYRYQIKKGAESRVFANARRVSETVIESDEELNSIYLDPLTAEPIAPIIQSPVNDPVKTSVDSIDRPPIQTNKGVSS